jgi:hypothetical protein
LNHNRDPSPSDLRYAVVPIELLRNTFRSRLARQHPTAPDSQFEFMPRRRDDAGAN